MKSIYLFSTKLKYFLTEIPPIILLVVSICYNDKVKILGKLYPMIIATSILIVYIALFFIRGIRINVQQIKCFGRFSEHDRAEICENRELVITTLPKRMLKIELFGESTDFETFAWLKSDTPSTINLFRSKCCGGTGKIKKILKYFDVANEEIENLLATEAYKTENENFRISSSLTEGVREVRIYFKETL